MCVNNLPKVVNWKRESGSGTRDLRSRKSNARTITPAAHTTLVLQGTQMMMIKWSRL